MSNWYSSPVFTIFLSVVQESNEILKLFLILSLNITCISGLGINVGTNRYKLLISTLIALPIVVNKISCKSAVLNEIWNPRFLVTFFESFAKSKKNVQEVIAL